MHACVECQLNGTKLFTISSEIERKQNTNNDHNQGENLDEQPLLTVARLQNLLLFQRSHGTNIIGFAVVRDFPKPI